jgi:hypothetical protein
LGRSQAEIKTLLQTIAAEIHAETARVPAGTPQPARIVRTPSAARTDDLVGELAKGFEGDWPYLAF